ncbi:MAG: glucose-6-phosphate isomerase [Anaerolineae bacterium]|nr:glucose-6-phosphate isomerase [Anaerolineae bacterium]
MNINDFRFWSGGALTQAQKTTRRLSHLKNFFQDKGAAEELIRSGDPVLYEVSEYEGGTGRGDLRVALTSLYPGKVGREYHMTKGHFHDPADFAELYLTFRGEGKLLLQSERGDLVVADMLPGNLVHIPGGMAHRTVNTGPEPLVFMGVYSAQAGHNYHVADETWFAKIVVEVDGQPVVMDNPHRAAPLH